MAKIEESVKKQLTKLIVTFLKYYPVRIRNVGEKEKQSRQIVWDFKDGREFENVAQETAQHFKEHFGDNRNLIVAAVTLILGGGDFTLHLGNFTLGGIGTATFGAIILNALMQFGEERIQKKPHEIDLTNKLED